MTYDLAEKLYKAGFQGIRCSDENPTPGYSFPNLSELVAACGEKFYSLVRRGRDGEEASWTTWTINGDLLGYKDVKIYAPSAEEAVAELWLALNPITL